ncbi:carotenoid biosynthesis protein [Adhaeribacter aquaticus]|uniref:carotenoid biosynthesis protein n=1 Tax=Adhaeribacter aquaticus TaxID=299567 RepID=UPI0004191B89|nr:carotenoid biosynthesis protein [Adhaeribacter aquaticus]
MKDKKLVIAVTVLIILHVVGFFGIAFSPYRNWFLDLTAFNLAITAFLLFSFHKTWNLSFTLFAAVAFAVGLVVELIGVHTNLLFGSYVYGNGLGPKLWDVPLVIALNWLMLVYITGVLVTPFKWHWLIKAFLAAGFMVLLDLLIEPVAAILNFWTWHNYQIPATNYWGWLGVGFLLQIYFQQADFQKANSMAKYVYATQFFFFLGFNLMF